MATVALSAWNFSQPPPLVSRLETAFVANVAANLDASPYLRADSRREIGNLLERDATAREVGDALYMAYARDWALDLRRKFGEAAVRVSWHGAERFGRPFRSPEPASSGRLKGRGEILEVSVPSRYVANDENDAITGGMGLTHMGFEARPYHLLKYPTSNRGRLFLRFAPPTVMEEGLLRFFGTSALRFCLTAGLVTPHQNLSLHKLGYHPLGIPMKAMDVHGFDAPPLGCSVHDAGHAALASSHVDAITRLSACLVYEAAVENLDGRGRKRLEWTLTRIEDLSLQWEGDFSGILKQWKNELPQRALRKTIGAFLEKWDAVRPEIGSHPEFLKIRRQVARLIASK